MSPCTVKVEPLNCKNCPADLLPIKVEEPVICPSLFNIKLSSVEAIVVSSTSNPPMEADLKAAKPWDDIEAEAFCSVDGNPPICAGVLRLFTVKSALITASAPITSNSFFGSKWNNEELISILPSEPLMNWIDSCPIKNESVLMSSSLGLVLNLKNVLAPPTNSKPTPL